MSTPDSCCELAPCPRCGHDLSYPDVVDNQPCRKCAKCHRELVGSHGPRLFRSHELNVADLIALRQAQTVPADKE